MEREITVIDDSDIVGWIAGAVREDEIYMTDVESMVKNVLKALRPYSRTCSYPPTPSITISRLNILDHGNTDGIEIGKDWIDVSTLPAFKPILGRLKGNFSASGFVHLQHCNVGQNRVLLLDLAKTFGVPVYAGTGAHNPFYRINFGSYVRANPDGSFHADAARP